MRIPQKFSYNRGKVWSREENALKPTESCESAEPMASLWPHRLAWALAITVFPLIWMGGTVTTYDAGMAVPDWPTTYDYWFYPIKLWLAVWDVFLEHGHRLMAQLAGILAILLAVALWRLDDRKWMRWVGVAIVLGVIAQGVLGGLRVWADDRVLARIHGCTAPLYFALCAAVVIWTSRTWRQRRLGPAGVSDVMPRSPSPLAPLPEGEGRLAWFVTAAVYVEIVLGAQLRRPSAELGFGAIELSDWMKRLTFGQAASWFELWVWLKVLNAGVIALGIAWLVVRLLRQRRTAARRDEPVQRVVVRRAVWLAAIVSVQLMLAITTWVTNYGWPAWFTEWIWPLQSAVFAQGRLLVLLTTAHAAIGSLTLIAALGVALWSAAWTERLSAPDQPRPTLP